MKTLFSKSLVFVSIYLLLSVTIFAQSKVKSIDELMQRYYDYSQFNGTVLVADSVGIVFSKGYGYANLEWNISNDVSTKFRIGSVTKQFTAVLILQLVEAGKIDLNKTISDYLPYYREDNGKRANIHQLLTHTSGIPSYTGLPNFADEISKTKSNPKDFVVKHCSGDFEFEPGSQFLYNNSGYFILGAIIEEVTGKDYATFLKENILVPLNMSNSGLDNSDLVLANRASGYLKIFKQFTNTPYVDMSLPFSAGSMYSTVDDLYKWDRALRNNTILSNEYTQKLFGKYESAFGGYYGYGFVISKESFDGSTDSLTAIRHGGDINGFSSLYYATQGNGQAVILLNNYNGFPRVNIAQNLLKILNDQKIEYPKLGISYKLHELILEDGIDAAVEAYKILKKNEFESFFFAENELNNLGYYLMNSGLLDDALKMFQLNIDEYSEGFNTYDSMGEALLKAGKSDLAIENFRKSLELNPGNDNARTNLKKLGVVLEEKYISVDDKLLAKYVGKYELFPNFAIEVTLDGDRLFTQATGQQKFEIFPKTETEFYLKVVNAQIEFKQNPKGDVDEIILYQGGQVIPGKRVE